MKITTTTRQTLRTTFGQLDQGTAFVTENFGPFVYLKTGVDTIAFNFVTSYFACVEINKFSPGRVVFPVEMEIKFTLPPKSETDV